MLGVRRVALPEAAGKLKIWRDQLSPRHITVLDRSLLNAHVCECYEVVNAI